MLLIRDRNDTFGFRALDSSLGFLLGALGGSLGLTSGALCGCSVSLGVLLVSFWELLGFACFPFGCPRRPLGAPLASVWRALGVIWGVSGFVWLARNRFGVSCVFPRWS